MWRYFEGADARWTKKGPSALYAAEVDDQCPPRAQANFRQGEMFGLAAYSHSPQPGATLMNTGYFPSDLEGSIKGVIGLQVWEMGRILGASLRGSLSLCSQPTEGDDRISEPPKQAHTLPLPTHRELVSPLL